MKVGNVDLQALLDAEGPDRANAFRFSILKIADTHTSTDEILQREQQTAAPGLWAIAYGVILAITVGFLALIAWGLHRLARTAEEPTQAGEADARPSQRSTPVGRPVEAAR